METSMQSMIDKINEITAEETIHIARRILSGNLVELKEQIKTILVSIRVETDPQNEVAAIVRLLEEMNNLHKVYLYMKENKAA
jgi:hypothetical protein